MWAAREVEGELFREIFNLFNHSNREPMFNQSHKKPTKKYDAVQ